MDSRKLVAGAAAALALSLAASPAQSQHYPYPPRQQDRVSGEIQRGVEAAAQAAGTIANALRGTRESIAVGACRVRAARYGNATVTEVSPKGSRSLRVRGFIDAGSDSSFGYRRDYPPRSFTCTVRHDGSISKFKTKRLRR
ncbi:MAG TPA: hypothetical protein VNT77_01155 [Allosphingosinicella sp.]|nr:hypothetical protein [Allosphingosinicella sp.]